MAWRNQGNIKNKAKFNRVSAQSLNCGSHTIKRGVLGLNDTVITFLSDISGNIKTTGNMDIDGGNLLVNGKVFNPDPTTGTGTYYGGNGTFDGGNVKFSDGVILTSNAGLLTNNTNFKADGYIQASGSGSFSGNGTFQGGNVKFSDGVILTSSATLLTNNTNFKADGFIKADGRGSFNGNGTFNGTVLTTALQCSSDEKLKKNIKPLNDSYTVDNLNPVEFNWISNDLQIQLGFLANEIRYEYPFMISEDKNKKLSMNYNHLIAILVKEIKNLKISLSNAIEQIDSLSKEDELLNEKLNVCISELKKKNI